MSVQAILAHKMRSVLTMLGIIIGVAAVIVIVSLGNGMQQYMNAQFEQISVNLIQVAIYSYGGNREVEPDDMYALAEKYPQYIDSVSPLPQRLHHRAPRRRRIRPHQRVRRQ